jgi:hypothetical protein
MINHIMVIIQTINSLRSTATSPSHSQSSVTLRSETLTDWADQLEAALMKESSKKGLFLTDKQVEIVMNALEGWKKKSISEDDFDRKRAFEMIQEIGEESSKEIHKPTS